jgi:hypothetical protein
LGRSAVGFQQIHPALGVIMKQELAIARPRPAAHVWRAAAATVRGFVEGVSAETAAKQMWPDDVVTPLVLRGAVTQATTSDPAWAGPLAFQSVSTAIEEAVAMAAIGRVVRAGALAVDLGRNTSVRVPGRTTSAADAGQWVQEGHPIPARQLTMLSGPTLTPTKLAVLVTMTREMTEASNIEDVVRVLLTEAASLALDAAVFSTAAAVPGKPAGILNGVTALTPTAGGTGFDSCGQDLGALVEDIATRAGGAHAFFVAAPHQAISVRFWAGGQFSVAGESDVLPLAASAGLADGTVLCIEPASFAITLGEPEFSVATVATVHQEDTTPRDIVSGTPATPVTSMWQTDALALRMLMPANWGMRTAHVSYMTGVQW